jgi:hypothetical protein
MHGSAEQSQPEQITKLNAAQRQLKTAIRLYFQDGDMVSIHTLAAAAQEVLRSLLRKRGGGSFMKDSAWIRPERRKEYITALNKPANFFKHGDQDPDAVLDFHPEMPVFLLTDCIAMEQTLTGRLSRESVIFHTWFAHEYPDLLESNLADQMRKFRVGSVITKKTCLTVLDDPTIQVRDFSIGGVSEGTQGTT